MTDPAHVLAVVLPILMPIDGGPPSEPPPNLRPPTYEVVQPVPNGPLSPCTGVLCRNWIWTHGWEEAPTEAVPYRIHWIAGEQSGTEFLEDATPGYQCGTGSCTWFTPFSPDLDHYAEHRYTLCPMDAPLSRGGVVHESLCVTWDFWSP